MKVLLFIILILSGNSFANNCEKKIRVLTEERLFSLNLFMPKITTKEYKEDIIIRCSTYNRAKIGDYLYLNDVVKRINYNKIIPHGEMRKFRFKILSK